MGEDDILFHNGVKGMKWGVRKAKASSGSPKKYSRAEKKAIKEKFYADKADNLVKTAMTKGNGVLIAVVTKPGHMPLVVTGKEFTEHLSLGGSFNSRLTDIYAAQETAKGMYVMNAEMNKSWKTALNAEKNKSKNKSRTTASQFSVGAVNTIS